MLPHTCRILQLEFYREGGNGCSGGGSDVSEWEQKIKLKDAELTSSKREVREILTRERSSKEEARSYREELSDLTDKCSSLEIRLASASSAGVGDEEGDRGADSPELVTLREHLADSKRTELDLKIMIADMRKSVLHRKKSSIDRRRKS